MRVADTVAGSAVELTAAAVAVVEEAKVGDTQAWVPVNAARGGNTGPVECFSNRSGLEKDRSAQFHGVCGRVESCTALEQAVGLPEYLSARPVRLASRAIM
jgi:hypothetical protein